MNKICPKCNTSNPAEANFCRHCGYEFQSVRVIKDGEGGDMQTDEIEQIRQKQAIDWEEKEMQYKTKHEIQKKIEELEYQPMTLERQNIESEKNAPSSQRKFSFKKVLVYLCIFLIGYLSHKCSMSEVEEPDHQKDNLNEMTDANTNPMVYVVNDTNRRYHTDSTHLRSLSKETQSINNSNSLNTNSPIEKEKIISTIEVEKSSKMQYGVFSVTPTTQVIFSPGNLQYRASTNEWRFAVNQWDIISSANKNISPTNEEWIDLFGWGTSGYNGKFPYMTSNNDKDYANGDNDIANTNYDWGVYNKIGSDNAGTWRTLTLEEWEYILEKRKHASSLVGKAKVNNQNGLILLPDYWTSLDSLSFSPGKNNDFSTNVYTVADWRQMENNGAIFLPSSGYRLKTNLYSIQNWGGYWMSSCIDREWGAWYLQFRNNDIIVFARDFRYGHAVRLVKDLQ